MNELREKYLRECEQSVFDALDESEMFTVEIAMKLETDCATVNLLLRRLERYGRVVCRKEKGKNLWRINN